MPTRCQPPQDLERLGAAADHERRERPRVQADLVAALDAQQDARRLDMPGRRDGQELGRSLDQAEDEVIPVEQSQVWPGDGATTGR
jgi:uncharacterized protein YfaA (DUF2138 family)